MKHPVTKPSLVMMLETSMSPCATSDQPPPTIAPVGRDARSHSLGSEDKVVILDASASPGEDHQQWKRLICCGIWPKPLVRPGFVFSACGMHCDTR
jgi:hypothetical protein